ncbi:hypothetical protein CLV59_110114 [Chitinophaga dinghuensis]|uniref:Uncharacterized protein n=1 Tax=Chitinophaga dinghuensis TaxID=1539050 RepID=A0A327VNF2_9BACT|nr:hypothetical protein CLV59_110114 [Chitinophaga dinghuensis]
MSALQVHKAKKAGFFIKIIVENREKNQIFTSLYFHLQA